MKKFIINWGLIIIVAIIMKYILSWAGETFYNIHNAERFIDVCMIGGITFYGLSRFINKTVYGTDEGW